MRFDYLPPLAYHRLFLVRRYFATSLASFGVLFILVAILPYTKIPQDLQQSTQIELNPLAKTGNTKLQSIENQILSNPLEEWTIVKVNLGDNLYKIFANLGLPDATLYEVLSANPASKQLSNLHPGQKMHFLLSPDQELKAIKMPISTNKFLHVRYTENGYKFTYDEQETIKKIAYRANTIKGSLFSSAQAVGLDDRLIMQLADIFGWDIDFAQDIREHDSFQILFEEEYIEDEKIDIGSILMAEFINQNRVYQAIRFTDHKKQTGYFSPEGYSMQKAFLRTPVKFTRISSHFSTKRRHPILHKFRAHNGVDYVAPRGTPVKAAGNGKIIFLGKRGGFGKAIELQHGNKYSTLYAHLATFATNLKIGSYVKQGQIIGSVGKTGLATGPHLHYEFRVNGVHHNPLTIQLPQASPINSNIKDEFMQYSKQMLQLLNKHQISYLARNG